MSEDKAEEKSQPEIDVPLTGQMLDAFQVMLAMQRHQLMDEFREAGGEDALESDTFKRTVQPIDNMGRRIDSYREKLAEREDDYEKTSTKKLLDEAMTGQQLEV